MTWPGRIRRQQHQVTIPYIQLASSRVLIPNVSTGLFLLAGTGSVLFMQSRLQLGWSRWEILQHFATRGGALMVSQSRLISSHSWKN